MAQAVVFMADGLEEIEGLTVVDILRRAGVDTQMVSVMGRKEITGSHGIEIKADVLFEEVDFSGVSMLVLPGGLKGKENLKAHEGVKKQITEFLAKDKYVAAICASPTIFGHMGILQGKRACCYEGMENELLGAQVSYEEVEQDGRIITSRGMGTSIAFALKLTEIFCGADAAETMGKKIIYRR